MGELHFPLRVRLVSLVQRTTNSGLTRAEEKHLAREYRATIGRTPTRNELALIRARLEDMQRGDR